MSTLVHYRKRDGQFEAARIEAKETFLKLISEGHSVTYASRRAGIHRNTPYAWSDEDPDFAYSWESAKESQGDWFEDRLRDSAATKNPTSIIVGLKMHKRFVEATAPVAPANLVLNQLNVVINEATPEAIRGMQRAFALYGEERVIEALASFLQSPEFKQLGAGK
ncbi:MAG: hypothetical protein U0990_00970 [Candidatus Nanopelagicales bacterium]|nr:hypothetical protein [Candidatus Nanopelagicales bacterium]